MATALLIKFTEQPDDLAIAPGNLLFVMERGGVSVFSFMGVFMKHIPTGPGEEPTKKLRLSVINKYMYENSISEGIYRVHGFEIV